MNASGRKTLNKYRTKVHEHFLNIIISPPPPPPPPQANLAVQEARLAVAMKDLNEAQAELDAKQAELDEVQAQYENAVREKQVCLVCYFLEFIFISLDDGHSLVIVDITGRC